MTLQRETHVPESTRLALLKGLANAANDPHILGDGVRSLLGHDLIGLTAELAALGVAENDPGNGHVREHVSGDLLRGNRDFFRQHMVCNPKKQHAGIFCTFISRCCIN